MNMEVNNTCGEKSGTKHSRKENQEYETINIEKTDAGCSLCEDYVAKNIKKRIAVISCEGACLRGEISRRVANMICHKYLPNETVRICSGSALTKESGQRNLVKKAKTVVILEGCPIQCATRSMRGVVPDLVPVTIYTDSLATFDNSIFGVNEIPDDQITHISTAVAEKVVNNIRSTYI
jgi:uncharacterized metal-binding protein